MDTPAVAQRLEEGGFTREQATVLADVLRDEVTDEVATKEHVTAQVSQLRAEVADVRVEVADVRAEVAGVRAEVADVRTEVAEVRAEVGNVKKDVDRLGREIDLLSQDMKDRLDALRNELKEYVHLVVSEASARLEAMIQQELKGTVKWMAGMLIVQTLTILTGTVGLWQLLS